MNADDEMIEEDDWDESEDEEPEVLYPEIGKEFDDFANLELFVD